jgi:DNA-dependent RNA polymerase auxiliary subunit epsilon
VLCSLEVVVVVKEKIGYALEVILALSEAALSICTAVLCSLEVVVVVKEKIGYALEVILALSDAAMQWEEQQHQQHHQQQHLGVKKAGSFMPLFFSGFLLVGVVSIGKS